MTQPVIMSLSLASDRLRDWALEVAPGELLGSEDTLMTRLGCSRTTLRQAARVLEREGLLRVRRGPSGGYFAARPDANTIEQTVSAYLQTIEIDPEDLTVIASALWVEAMRKAARAEPDRRHASTARVQKQVDAIRDDATFQQVRDVELITQEVVFGLARSEYIKLVFDINVAFSRRRWHAPVASDTPERELLFVRAWKQAKHLELGAIGAGNPELAALAGRYSRDIWHRRVWQGWPAPAAKHVQVAAETAAAPAGRSAGSSHTG